MHVELEADDEEKQGDPEGRQEMKLLVDGHKSKAGRPGRDADNDEGENEGLAQEQGQPARGPGQDHDDR